jgi:hypothetical protein
MSDQQPPKTGTARVLWELEYDEVETFFEAGDDE